MSPKFCLEHHLPTDPARIPPAPTYERGSHPCRRRDVRQAVEIVELHWDRTRQEQPYDWTCIDWRVTETVEGPWMPTAQLYPTAGKVYTIDA